MQPPSLRTFRSLWSAMLLLLAAGLLLGWGQARAGFAANPALQGYDLNLLVAIRCALGLAMPLLILMFVLRRSRVARLLAVLLAAFNVAILAAVMVRGQFGGGFGGVLSVVTVALEAAGAAMLFRADARAWFGRDREEQPGI